MMLVENEAKEQGIWKEELTAIEANFMYGKVFELITEDLGHRHCGLGVLSWQHVYNLLKAIEHKKKKEAAGGADTGSATSSP